jgi:hypothetical protein
MMDVFAAYPSCFGDHCDDEPWDSSFWQWYVDDPDGRSAADFKYHFEGLLGVNAVAPHALNCEP